MPTIKILGFFDEKSIEVIDNPVSIARSRRLPALRGRKFSAGLCSLIILYLFINNIINYRKKNRKK